MSTDQSSVEKFCRYKFGRCTRDTQHHRISRASCQRRRTSYPSGKRSPSRKPTSGLWKPTARTTTSAGNCATVISASRRTELGQRSGRGAARGTYLLPVPLVSRLAPPPAHAHTHTAAREALRVPADVPAPPRADVVQELVVHHLLPPPPIKPAFRSTDHASHSARCHRIEAAAISTSQARMGEKAERTGVPSNSPRCAGVRSSTPW